jgi:hypothetical protein
VFEVKVALDAIGIYVNQLNPLLELSLSQARDIYTGRITDWRDAGGVPGKIILYSCENNSGTYEFFKEHVLKKADHACNLARAALDMGAKPQLRTLPDLLKMSRIAREMLRKALDSFAAGDSSAARAVIERDEEVNQLYDLIFHDLLDRMSRDPGVTGNAARFLLVAKHLERIGDYVTDICEQIVYLRESVVIKHQRLSN